MFALANKRWLCIFPATSYLAASVEWTERNESMEPRGWRSGVVEGSN